jgi:hypothetical protein
MIALGVVDPEEATYNQNVASARRICRVKMNFSRISQ